MSNIRLELCLYFKHFISSFYQINFDEIELMFTLPASFPTPNATKTVKFVTKTLTTEGMIENLNTFTSFRTRCELVRLPVEFILTWR